MASENRSSASQQGPAVSEEFLANLRAEYQEKARAICPMEERDVKALTALFDIYKGDNTYITRQSAGEIYDYEKISQREKDECLAALPEQINLETFLAFRKKQMENRTYREKLRHIYAQISDDGVNLDYDKLLAAIDAGASDPENEKIVLHAFFYKSDPPVVKRPLNEAGEKYPITMPIETLIKNYFKDE